MAEAPLASKSTLRLREAKPLLTASRKSRPVSAPLEPRNPVKTEDNGGNMGGEWGGVNGEMQYHKQATSEKTMGEMGDNGGGASNGQVAVSAFGAGGGGMNGRQQTVTSPPLTCHQLRTAVQALMAL